MRHSSVRTAPLSHERLAILLALSCPGRNNSIASVSDQVISDSVGSIYIKKSTLYKFVKELESEGHISMPPPALTEKGIRTLKLDIARTENYLQLLKQRADRTQVGRQYNS